jgi:hypothetical protein
VTVERLQREAAGVDLAALGHEFLDLCVEIQVSWEGFVAELGEAALHAQGDARPVEQHRRLEALALEPHRLQQVDETDRAFEGHRVERDERLFTGCRLDVFEHLLFVIDEEVTGLVGSSFDLGHDASVSDRSQCEPRATLRRASKTALSALIPRPRYWAETSELS